MWMLQFLSPLLYQFRLIVQRRAKDRERFGSMSLFWNREQNRGRLQTMRTELIVKSGISWERPLSDLNQVPGLKREGFSGQRTNHHVISHIFLFASQTIEVWSCHLRRQYTRPEKKKKDRWAPSPRRRAERLPRGWDPVSCRNNVDQERLATCKGLLHVEKKQQ